MNAKGGIIYKGSLLHYAVLYADVSVIAALLDRDADLEFKDIDGFTALHIITQVANNISHTHLRIHWNTEQENIAALLLEYGADANAQDDGGQSPLHHAFDPVVATLLLSYGADVNAVVEYGWTPLFIAARHGASDAIVILLEHGADISAVSSGREAPLLAALSSGNFGADAISLLLEHGVDVDAKSRDGQTACQSASGYINDAIRDLICS